MVGVGVVHWDGTTGHLARVGDWLDANSGEVAERLHAEPNRVVTLASLD